MTYPNPIYTRGQVNRAGDVLCAADTSSNKYTLALRILSNWRAAHGYPINTFQKTLRDKINIIGNDKTIVAQRLKRTPSIIAKLKREEDAYKGGLVYILNKDTQLFCNVSRSFRSPCTDEFLYFDQNDNWKRKINTKLDTQTALTFDWGLRHAFNKYLGIAFFLLFDDQLPDTG